MLCSYSPNSECMDVIFREVCSHPPYRLQLPSLRRGAVLEGCDSLTSVRDMSLQAKQLLKRYGSAYLITSISFAIVSFAACYALVSSGALTIVTLEHGS